MTTRRNNFLRTLREGFVFGIGMTIAFVALVLAVTLFLGNQEQETLNQIRDLQLQANANTRANICQLGIETIVDEDGGVRRPEDKTNSLCLIPNGLDPIDVNGDGVYDVIQNDGS